MYIVKTNTWSTISVSKRRKARKGKFCDESTVNDDRPTMSGGAFQILAAATGNSFTCAGGRGLSRKLRVLAACRRRRLSKRRRRFVDGTVHVILQQRWRVSARWDVLLDSALWVVLYTRCSTTSHRSVCLAGCLWAYSPCTRWTRVE